MLFTFDLHKQKGRPQRSVMLSAGSKQRQEALDLITVEEHQIVAGRLDSEMPLAARHDARAAESMAQMSSTSTIRRSSQWSARVPTSLPTCSQSSKIDPAGIIQD